MTIKTSDQMMRIDPMKRTLLKILGLSALTGCASAQGEGRSVSIDQYNYTDRYIGDISVNGVWAGDVGAYQGGGDRIQGLLGPKDLNKQIVLKVKWSVGSYYSIKNNSYARAPLEQHSADVELPRPYPPDFDLLVLHFYPDGHVEAELTGKRKNRRIPQPEGFKK
jgi:hypothetical protein